METQFRKSTISILLMVLLLAGCHKQTVKAPAQGAITAQTASQPNPPAAVVSKTRPLNITAIGDALWSCGTLEQINVSTDGGENWSVKHVNPAGETLLNISFIDSKTGFAGGTGGLLLTTTDAGATWKAHRLGDTVRAFSFADASHGIVVTSKGFKDTSSAVLTRVNGNAWLNATVSITHDGGEQWQEVTALKKDPTIRDFSEVHSVAALDATRFLISLHQLGGEYIYVSTQDGGKTWKPMHLDDIYAATIFVHNGEYWAFGIEMLDPKKRRYGAPVTLHSKDGLSWTHGIRGNKEFASCTRQGCDMWEGAIEDLYGDQEIFWTVPQDGSVTSKWAIAAGHICSIATSVSCGTASVTKQPPPKPERHGWIHVPVGNLGFIDDCLSCVIKPMEPRPVFQGRARV